MLSLYLNQPSGHQDFYYYPGTRDPMKMALPGLQSQQPDINSENTVRKSSDSSAGAVVVPEDPSKRVRKPYTITKSRESWTDEEHDKFIEALHLFDRDWKKIEAFVRSKTVIQMRWPWILPPFHIIYSCGSNESSHLSWWPINAAKNSVQKENDTPSRVVPDFEKVYSFMGSIFDPTASDHLQRRRQMDSINVETVVTLMNNLSVNLLSPECDYHRRVIASYCGCREEKENVVHRNIESHKFGCGAKDLKV